MSLPENTAYDVDAVVVLAVGVALPLAGLIASAFWNHGTTLETSTPAVVAVSALTSLPIGLGVLYHWFKPRQKLDPPPHWNLKHDSPGTWVLTGIGAAVLVALCVSYTSFVLVGVLAQHFGGSQTRISAQVEAIHESSRHRGVCHRWVDFKANWDQSFNACVNPAFGPALTTRRLHVGERVVLKISESIFGAALVGVDIDEH